MKIDEQGVMYKNILEDKRFARYFELLAEWNERFNLTTIIQRDDVYLKHFYDSVLALDLFPPSGRLLDIGSGAGLPAIPLKLLLPKINVTMIESVGKKVSFLREVISCLELDGITAHQVRIEDFKERDFDIVTARAVAPLPVLLEYGLPFLKLFGKMIAYKGGDISQEIEASSHALDVLGGTIESVELRSLCEGINRSFVIIKKTKPTPAIYPRGQNKPRLKPL